MKRQFLAFALLLTPFVTTMIQACEVCYAEAMDETAGGFASSYGKAHQQRHKASDDESATATPDDANDDDDTTGAGGDDDDEGY